ncbi:CapA family protein [Leucobacter iarius]|uniref:Capsule synthesis protein CapA domain-containing protein n=1 Tax=Leucobacter iarius TaxID=333963 RepID=A0ABN2LMZ4_9MICO
MSDDPNPVAPARRRPARRTRLAITLSVVALLLIGGGAAAAFAFMPHPVEPKPKASSSATPSPSASSKPTTPDVPKPISVIAMGDMLPHDSVNQNAKQADGTWNYGQFFTGITKELDAADVRFCNQEVPSAGVEFGISGYPTFNAPTEFARDLRKTVGCDLVNTATNHTADKGVEGIAATRKAWDTLKPAIVDGANRSAQEQQTVPIFEKDGVKIALVSFAEYSNAPIDGVSLNLMSNDALVTQLMAQARKQADVVIVSAHWGTEDSHEVNDQQRGFAQKVANLGADVVIGTGPHVLQPVAWLDRSGGGRTLVWYSIGNMLNTQIALDQRTGLIARFELARAKAGGPVTVQNPTGVLTYMHYDWTAEDEAANRLDARKNLSITPLADSASLLSRTRFGVTPAQQAEASAKILGPDVKLEPR